ncbi:hypothetical protein T07_7399 [Trichinella nelsoni]|uniref:Uncharacterized protein n=1 Tax=Trichinella nelsoni TaxID=6336 RepID=A0A0V0SJE5_9BILA|nr:hypothetical protein T07_7399 [Trichinella nelsoni]
MLAETDQCFDKLHWLTSAHWMRSAWIGDEEEESVMGIDSDLKMKKKALRMNSERSQALFDCMAAKMNEASNEQCTAVVLQWRCPKLIACRWLVDHATLGSAILVLKIFPLHALLKTE